jgi:hypothetical protein
MKGTCPAICEQILLSPFLQQENLDVIMEVHQQKKFKKNNRMERSRIER